eukprot:CAMPEP_0171457068 /NCGR_PEP_ID=MMETSP0945-20130129/3293_1 /TAXON_ID=109269 /ORGANISM="Vaucheria litorea, Strain CCMP2940" /LENGTH=188 /DNA_ID=CAMNT_0011982599 /DNA_START=158 /DNA_END=724 /DNA_ORIENTATION=-
MIETDRGIYSSVRPYDDCPQAIGFGQTISAPHMHAWACEYLIDVIPEENGKVLDVGCGSGYLTSVLARILGPTGKVWGIDYLSPMVELSETNIKKDDPKLINSGRVNLSITSGWDGLLEGAPYDAIHVGAAAESIPMKLVQQLKTGGRMIIPIGPKGQRQELVKIDSTEHGYIKNHLMDVNYVPLVKN